MAGTAATGLSGGTGGYGVGGGLALEAVSSGEIVTGVPFLISGTTFSGNTASVAPAAPREPADRAPAAPTAPSVVASKTE